MIDAITLALIKKMGGQSTGQSTGRADWNQNDETAPDYIKNRTHYIELDAIQLLRGMTRAYTASGLHYYDFFSSSAPAGTNMNDFNSDMITEGATMQLSMDPASNSSSNNYSPLFSGKLSRYSATDTDGSIYNYYIFGNMSYLDKLASRINAKVDFGTHEDTGEEAVVVIVQRTLNGELVTNYPRVYVCFDSNKIGSLTIQFKIDALIEKLVQLDEKFIPDTIARVKDIDVVSKDAYTFEWWVDENKAIAQPPLLADIQGDKQYTIEWDGTIYKCTPFSMSDEFTAYCIGNQIVVGGVDSGEPFVIIYMVIDGGSQFAVYSMYDTATSTHNVHVTTTDTYVTETQVRNIIDDVISNALNDEV